MNANEIEPGSHQPARGTFENVNRVFSAKPAKGNKLRGFLKMVPTYYRTGPETFEIHTEFWHGDWSAYYYLPK
jgi:hypothetical protein